MKKLFFRQNVDKLNRHLAFAAKGVDEDQNVLGPMRR
jgi:hypothetical protein